MEAVNMKISYINNKNINHQYISDYSTYKAYQELEKYYGPYELFTKVTTYFRSVNELPSYIGKGVYSNIDFIIQNISNSTSFNPNLSQSLFGGGKGRSFSKVLISTLGEMFERIIGALSYYEDKEDFIYGSYEELSKEKDLLNPENMKIFADEQYNTKDFNFLPFKKNTPIRWVRGSYWISNKNIWVPAQLVYIFFPFEVENEKKIGYSTSGGLSLHDNENLALYHGITECIERDQINLRWYNKIPPDSIPYSKVKFSEFGQNIIDESNKNNTVLRSQYHNLDLHEYPVVTSTSFDKNLTKFSFCAGGGVGSDLSSAIESSFKEYGQSELNLKSLFYNPNWYSSKSMIELFGFEEFDIDNMQLFYEIVPFYGLKKNRNKLDWYLESNKKYQIKNSNKKGNEIERLRTVLSENNIDPIIFDMTPLGFNYIKLMKSYIPDLTQAFLPNSPCLGHRRFYETAFKNGYIDKKLEYSDLNNEPLPFP